MPPKAPPKPFTRPSKKGSPVNVVLVDLCAVLYYKYYSTKCYLSLRSKARDANGVRPTIDGEELPELTTDEFSPIFVDFYADGACKHVRKLVKNLAGIKQPNVDRASESTLDEYYTNIKVYFCCDQRRETLWRREQDPLYKSNREGSVVNHAAICEVKDALMEEYGEDRFISVPRVEADDIAYHFGEAISKKMDEANMSEDTSKIYVVTGDTDYYQLPTNRYIIVKPRGELDLKFAEMSENERRGYAYRKAIRGDTSDCVPGAGSMALAVKIDHSADTMVKVIDYIANLYATKAFGGKFNKPQYKHNVKMMCIDQLPANLITAILEDPVLNECLSHAMS